MRVFSHSYKRVIRIVRILQKAFDLRVGELWTRMEIIELEKRYFIHGKSNKEFVGLN